MLKDLSQSLVAAVAAINQKSREAYVAEQQAARKPKLPGVPQPKADPAAHAGAASMAKANIKEGSEGTAPTTPKEKKLAAMSGDKTKITKGDVLKARGVSEEAVEEGVMDTVKKVGKKVLDTLGHKDDSELIKDLQKKAGVPQTGKKPVKEGWEDMLKAAREKAKPQPNGGSGKKQGTAYGGSKQKDVKEDVEQVDEALRTVSKHGEGTGEHHAVVKRDAEYNEYQVHFYKNGKHMGEGPVSYHDDKKDAQDTADHEVKRMNTKKEEVENIAELSKSTLGSYVKKAATAAGAAHAIGSDFRHQSFDSTAKSTKAKNTDKKEKLAKDARVANTLADRFYNAANKRHAGIGKAVNRLTKEEAVLTDEEATRIAELAAKFDKAE